MSQVSVERVAQLIQQILGPVARQLGIETQFIQRYRVLTPESFIQGLVLTWLSNPDATLEQLAQAITATGTPITPQSLDERFTSNAAQFLEKLLLHASSVLIHSQAPENEFMSRFSAIYVHDGTTIVLPNELEPLWRGCGGSEKRGKAALKLQMRFEVRHGQLTGPLLCHGRENDAKSSLYQGPFEPGSLVINDLGYFKLSTFKKHNKNGVFWLSRMVINTKVYETNGEFIDLKERLSKFQGQCLDQPVLIGSEDRVRGRLIAIRVPSQVAAERRRKLKEKALEKGKQPSQMRLEFCDWVLLVTNIWAELMSPKQALSMYRIRWQIELLFRLWKKECKVDKSRSKKPWRVLCEVYAKLLGVLLLHWLLLLGTWHIRNRSLEKAAQTVKRFIPVLAFALAEGSQRLLFRSLRKMLMCLQKGCRINKSRKTPRRWQIILALEADISADPGLS